MMPPGLLPNCPKPPELDNLYNEWLKWATLTNVLTELLNAYNLFGFWKGVADMSKDIVNAAGLLLPGAGSVAAKGLNMLVGMATDGALDMMMDGILDNLGLSDIKCKGACAAALSFANGKRQQALAAYNKVWYAYIDCQNKVNEKNITLQADLVALNKVKATYLKNWADYQKCVDDPKRCGWVECK